MSTTGVCWFRRDLRLCDNPALITARAGADAVLGLFVLDDALCRPSGDPRLAFLYRSLRSLDEALDGRLLVVRGRPEDVVPAVARMVDATAVQVAADFGPYGRVRDERVAAALALRGCELRRTGSSYAVQPGRVRKADGDPFRVYTPFYRAWRRHGWGAPVTSWSGPDAAARVPWLDGLPLLRGTAGLRGRAGLPGRAGIPAEPDLPAGLVLPPAGEPAALARWHEFRATVLPRYDGERDRPALLSTSRLSVYLKFGAVHPRTLLAGLVNLDDGAGPADSPLVGGSGGSGGSGRLGGSGVRGQFGQFGQFGESGGSGAERFRAELAWREFYADVLWHQPRSAWECLRPATGGIELDTGPDADTRFAAWAEGRTGYPIVDAGMRQLRAEAWVHNRVRMIVASFLVKDLHLDWRRGAAEFLGRLVDGDLASNNAGWQWVAGCGTDPAPYHRIFNPVLQGRKFDPNGDYVRRYVPQLREVAGPSVHEPWRLPGGPPVGYPLPIVEHAVERAEALARYAATRALAPAPAP